MIDPHRTLGVLPGATQAEIKRAYRRLAKQYHPDSAGPKALPRFLAIQAAYEALLATGRPCTPGGTPTGGPKPDASAGGSAAWRADAERARATREAYRARYRSASWASGRPSGGQTAGPAADESGSAGSSSRGAASGRGAGASPGSAAGATSSKSRAGRRRTKATIGSTSYDGADAEPFTPSWDGATWYGPGSGTYWTVNPKEYADPRKHGPEYQARSRRRSGAGGDPATSDLPEPGGAEVSGASSPPAAGSADGGDNVASAGSGSSPPDGAFAPPGGRVWASSGPPLAGVGHGIANGTSVGLPGWLRSPARSTLGRLGLAILGWIPIALAISAAAASVPVCQTASTVCADPLTGGIGIVHLLGIVLLVAVPRLGWIAAVAATAFFIGGLLATPLLLILGGSQTPEGSGVALRIVVALAWLGGVVLALTGRLAPASEEPLGG